MIALNDKGQFEIQIDELRKKSLFVGTPMYGGNCSGFYTNSMINLSRLCQQYGIKFTFYGLFNESLVTRSRNYITAAFLESDFTHLLFIDSDIEFQPLDALALLAMTDSSNNMDVVCGLYPKKTLSWEKIKLAVDKGFADENPAILEQFTADLVFNPAKSGEYKKNEPIEVMEAGTGFMCIDRKTFEAHDKAYPHLKYKPDHVRTKDFDGSKEIMCYFDCEIDPVSRRYLSEDYKFCQDSRKLGLKVYVCPWMNVNHVGTYKFLGNVQALSAINASLTADPEEIKNMKS